jgi:hypothetical protein
MIKAELTDDGFFHWEVTGASPADVMTFALFVLSAVAEPKAKEKFDNPFSQAAEFNLHLKDAIAEGRINLATPKPEEVN